MSGFDCNRFPRVEIFIPTLIYALGFFFGASLGALGATKLPADVMRRVFGVFLLLISLHMILGHRGEKAIATGTVATE